MPRSPRNSGRFPLPSGAKAGMTCVGFRGGTRRARALPNPATMRSSVTRPLVGILLGLTLGVGVGVAGCGTSSDAEAESPAEVMAVRGSDTMVVLASRWADRMMAEREGLTVQTIGGGSGTGISALVRGTAEVATLSRALREEERARIREARGVDPLVVPVAIDAMAIYVSEENAVRALTLEQLREAFRGRAGRWSLLGGSDTPVVLYGRTNASGSYAFFKERVLRGADFSVEMQSLPGTAALINAIRRDPGGIGYGGIGYGTGAPGGGVVALAIGEGEDAVAPSLDEALVGRYPLARSLSLIVASDDPQSLGHRFIAFALSDQGQDVVEQVGYYPLTASGLEASRARLAMDR